MNNKFLSIAASTAIVASALVFTGCGDSDSSSAADTTPTASTASGTLTATAIKGKWSGLNYTVTGNGTGKNTTATMSSGKVNFNKADNVTIDLGLAQWKLNDLTTNNTVFSFNQAGTDNRTSLLSKSGGILTAAQVNAAKANILSVIAMMNNNTATVEAAGFNAGTMIAAMKILANQGLDVTETGTAAFISALNANFSTPAMRGKNVTSASDAVNTYSIELRDAVNETFGEAVAASTASASNALNHSKINGTFIYLKNGTGTYVLDAYNGNHNLTTGGALGTPGTWAASGSIIKLGSTNTSDLAKDYIVFGGAIDASGASATPATYVDSNGVAYSYTLTGIKANLSNIGYGNANYDATKYQNLTVTSLGSTVLTLNLTKGNHSTMKYANRTYVNTSGGSSASVDTARGNYSIANDAYGLPTVLALYSDNAGTVPYMNLSFDYNPSYMGTSGVVATILYAVESWISAMKTFLLSLFQA